MNLLRLRALSVAVVLAFGLAGCSDDEVPSTSTGGSTPTDPGGDVPAAAEIVGQVVKGVTRHAQVTVYAPDGSELASTTSGPDGAYALMLPAGYEGAVQLVVTPSAPPAPPTMMRCDAPSGCGAFSAADAEDINGNLTVDFGEWAPVEPDFRMRAVAAIVGGGLRLINLTPLSTMAAEWAFRFPQGLDERSALAANTQAAVAFGFALSDLESPLGDVTDPLWLSMAEPQQIKLALLMATFAEVASLYDLSVQLPIDMAADAFAEQDGRLMEASLEPVPTVAYFLDLAAKITVAGTIVWPDNVMQDEMEASFVEAIAQLETGALTDGPALTLARVLQPMGQLGQDIDELLTVTGLLDPTAFANGQLPFYDWLLVDDNLQMASLAVEVATYALYGASLVDVLPTSLGAMTLVSDETWTVTLDPQTRTLVASGNRHGQVFDLAIGLTGLTTGINSGQFDFTLQGTVENATAKADIDGSLSVDTGDTDFSAYLAANALLSDDNPDNDAQAWVDVRSALLALAYSAEADVTLAGTAYLVRNSDPSQVLGGEVSLNGHLDLGAADDEVIASLVVHSGLLRLPDGSELYSVDGKPLLTVNVTHDATVVLDGAGRMFNLPEATAHAEGVLGNARSIIDHVRNVLASQLDAESVELSALVTQLLDFDLARLSLRGQGVIDIPGMPSGRDHQYRASLDDLVLTVYQPHSEDVAMTATLDPETQSVHLVLGSEQCEAHQGGRYSGNYHDSCNKACNEHWDMMSLMTPTPRFLLLGPGGLYGELSQEDVYAFLDSLMLDNVFAVFGFEAGSPEPQT